MFLIQGILRVSVTRLAYAALAACPAIQALTLDAVQTVVRAPSLIGFGNLPVRTYNHSEDAQMGIRAGMPACLVDGFRPMMSVSLKNRSVIGLCFLVSMWRNWCGRD